MHAAMIHRCVLSLALLAITGACSRDETPPATPSKTPPPTKSQPPTKAPAPTPEPPKPSPSADAPPFVDTATIDGWIDNRDSTSIRKHGYEWFAWLTSPKDGKMQWEAWPTTSSFIPHAGGTNCKWTGAGPSGLKTINRQNASVGSSAATGRLINYPDAPKYAVPLEIQNNPAYAGCIVRDKKHIGLRDGATLQNNGDVLVAGVVFNPIAADYITQNKLFDARVLDGMLPATGGDPPAFGTVRLPQNSVVLKVQSWPVKGDQGAYTPLPTWVEPTDAKGNVVLDKDSSTYSGFEVQGLWSTAVALTAHAGGPSSVPLATFLSSDVSKVPVAGQPGNYETLPVGYKDVPVHHVSELYGRQWTDDALAAMDPCDHALLDQAAYWAGFGRGWQSQDHLVVVSMHIMTKERWTEQPNGQESEWTFQSAWWTDATSAEANPQINKRPAAGSFPGPDTWTHYAMSSTYGMTQQPNGQQRNWPPGVDHSQYWPAAYNPYIELAAAHPIATNCMNCHMRAGWPSLPGLDHPDQKRSAPTSAYLLVDDSTTPDALKAFAPDGTGTGTSSGNMFTGLLLMDSMWSLSDRACYEGNGT
jgi:hypothetical protein